MNPDIKNLIVNIQDDVCSIHINRPNQRNAINPDVISEILHILTKIEQEPEVRFIIISSVDKVFSSGADLEWMALATKLSYEENIKDAEPLAELFKKISNSQKITIAEINGACIGGGIGIAAACDLVVGSDEAFFSFSEVKLGLVPATILPYIALRTGFQTAKYYMLTGEKIKADRAFEIHLLDVLSERNNLERTVNGVISNLREGGRQAQIRIKNMISSYQIKNLPKDFQKFSVNDIALNRISEEGIEGIRSFLEKRKPAWKK